MGHTSRPDPAVGYRYRRHRLLERPLSKAALPCKGIEAQTTRSPGCDIQKHKAVQGRELALVHDRPESARRVRHEIRYGHQAARDEGGVAGTESQSHETASEELDDHRCDHQRTGKLPLTAECAEEFLGSMACEQKPDHHAHESVGHL